MVHELAGEQAPFMRSNRVYGQPMSPMKYVESPESEWGALIDDDEWVAQQKFDGTRAFITITAYGVGWNGLKHSAAVQHFPRIEESLSHLRLGWGETIVLDGELMIRTGEYIVFDVAYMLLDGKLVVSQADPQFWRRNILEKIEGIQIAREARTRDEKAEMLNAARSAGVEGLVFKHRQSWYKSGRSSMVRKAKFVKTADVVVISSSRGRNESGREVGAFRFGVVPPFESRMTPAQQQSCEFVGDLPILPIGSCSAIGKPDAKVGDVIEVAYLYRDDAGGLVQPRMTRIREDKSPSECGFDQFPVYTRRAI